MSRKRDEHKTAADPAAEAPPVEPPAEAPLEAPADMVGDPTARLEAEVATLKDQLLRALAETENLRRRAAREREEAVRYAAVPLIRDLIGVADNLRRALTSVPAAANDEQFKTLLTGVEMTEKELQTIFARHHIERIEPLGERLDPHVHEALFEIPDARTPAGTVLRVLQAGYRLGERLIRPAQVAVAKGGNGETQPENGRAGDAGGGSGNGESKPGRHFDTTA
jgi:molecular chaperone GrpE